MDSELLERVLLAHGGLDQRTDFTPGRVAVEKLDGTVVNERFNPAQHAEGKALDAPWDALDREPQQAAGFLLWPRLSTS